MRGHLKQLSQAIEKEKETTEQEIEELSDGIKKQQNSIATKIARNPNLRNTLEASLEPLQNDLATATKKSSELDAALVLIDQAEKQIDQLPWPHPEDHGNVAFDVQFKDQPTLATASGFAFAPGYVMTSGHSFGKDFSTSKVVFDYLKGARTTSSGHAMNVQDEGYSSAIKR